MLPIGEAQHNDIRPAPHDKQSDALPTAGVQRKHGPAFVPAQSAAYAHGSLPVRDDNAPGRACRSSAKQQKQKRACHPNSGMKMTG